MRILAALTLLISVLLSPLSTAAPLELQWEFEVDPNQFLSGTTLVSVPSINNTPDGGCAARVTILHPSGERTVLFVLDRHGNLRWSSNPREALRPVGFRMISSANCVYLTLAGTYVSVDLNSRTEELITDRAESWDPPTFGYKWPTNSFLLTNGRTPPLPTRVVIQKWAPASPTPDLAPSTFGLEDGNLIISWPAAAGQTYQVQRSTDLESWENIGVALTGNGTTMSYSQPSNADKVFLRVVIP